MSTPGDRKKKQPPRRLSQTKRRLSASSAAGIYRSSGSFRTGIKRKGSKLSPTSPRTSANPFLSAAARRYPPAASSFEQRETDQPEDELDTAQADQTAGPSFSNPFLAAASVSTKLPYSAVVAGRHSKQQLSRPSRPPLHSMTTASSNQQQQRTTSRRPGQQPALSANPFIKALTRVVQQEQQAEETQQLGDEESMDEPEDTDWWTEEGHTQAQDEPMFNVAQHSDGPSTAARGSSNPFFPAVGDKSLHLKGVPRELNNDQALREHFERFGVVESVRCHPEKMFAQVSFATREVAVAAKKNGRRISPHHRPLTIFWFSPKVTFPALAKSPPDATELMSMSQRSSHVTEPVYHVTEPVHQQHDHFTDPGHHMTEDQLHVTQSRQHVTSRLGVREAPKLSERRSQQQQHTMPVLSYQEKHDEQNTESDLRRRLMERRRDMRKMEDDTGMDERDQDEIGQPLKVVVGQTGRSILTKRRRIRSEDDEYVPSDADEEDEEKEEGEKEKESALDDQRGVENEMDQIAHTALHPYYLRSLKRPGAYAGPSQSELQGEEVGEEGESVQQSYDPIPPPSLPPPPQPRGDTTADYLESLNARDKEMRKNQVKPTSLVHAAVIVGTCPDMCPERERYEREDRRQLSIFEVDLRYGLSNPRVDHAAAIKVYSGSAADKEEPLPHELRPLPVLMMTMDYIVTNIADYTECQWGTWYDFIWNRTRAIRKDITYQHLCEPECVVLTEQCARFHVLCSHLLCEVPVDTFDPKMNLENLTKCLQSLKEFYRDLRLDKGITCPNEAEFCCYDMLLHLTDGGVLKIVEQYSEHVCRSEEVKFAIAVVQALDSNNFVRFFKLVKAATFLSSCLLNRYFNQVRLKALQVLNNSHSVSGRTMHFSITDLTRILAFENKEETIHFCTLVGLHASNKVEFSKKIVVTPKQALPVVQCPHLVSDKSNQLYGEVIHGGPLPRASHHTPYHSFAAAATYQQQATRPPPPNIQLSPLPPSPPPPAGPSPQVVESLAVDIVESVISEVTVELARELYQEAEDLVVMKNSIVALTQSVLSEVLSNDIEQLVKEEMERYRQLAVLQHNMMVKQLVIEIGTSLLSSEVYNGCCSVAMETLRQTRVNSTAMVALGQVLSVGLESICVAVATDTIQQAELDRQAKLEQIEHQVRRASCARYWHRWRKAFKLRQHVRLSMAEFPPRGPLTTLHVQVDSLLSASKRRELTQSLVANVSQLTAGKSPHTTISDRISDIVKQRQLLIAPLDLTTLLRDALYMSSLPRPSSHAATPTLHWSLLLVCPSAELMSWSDQHCWDWLQGKLSNVPRAERTEIVSVLHRPSHASVVSGVAIGVKSCSVAAVTRRDVWLSVKGTTAILLYSPLPHSSWSPEVYSRHVRTQLHTLQAVLRSTPVVVVTPTELSLAHKIQLTRDIEAASDQVLLAALDEGEDKTEPSITTDTEHKLSEFLVWLAEHSSPQPTVTWTPLRHHAERVISDLFLSTLLADGKIRQTADLSSQSPVPIVSLFNSVVDHVCEQLCSASVRQLSWPASTIKEIPIDWNEDSHLSQIERQLCTLRLPQPPVVDSRSDWSSQCVTCLQYVKSVCHKTTSDAIILLSRVKQLLHTVASTDSSTSTVSWDQVILACVEHMLTTIPLTLMAGVVTAPVEALFRPPFEWQRAVAETTLALSSPGQQRECPRDIGGSKRRRQSDSVAVHEPAISRSRLSVSLDTRGGYHLDKKLAREGKQLMTSLSNEAYQSKSFEEQLQKWLASSDSPSMFSSYSSSLPTRLSPRQPIGSLSFSHRLQDLKAGLRTAKFDEAVDEVKLKLFVATSNL